MHELPESEAHALLNPCALYDKLSVAEREIDSGAIGEDFLLLAKALRSNIHGIILTVGCEN